MLLVSKSATQWNRKSYQKLKEKTHSSNHQLRETEEVSNHHAIEQSSNHHLDGEEGLQSSCLAKWRNVDKTLENERHQWLRTWNYVPTVY